MIPSGMVFRGELHLTYNIMFEAPSNREQPMTDHMTDFVEWLHDTYYYTHQHLNMASERMKAHYDLPANYAGFQEGDQVWLYCLTWTRKNCLSCKHPGKVLTR
jgi:hypothetical protein